MKNNSLQKPMTLWPSVPSMEVNVHRFFVKSSFWLMCTTFGLYRCARSDRFCTRLQPRYHQCLCSMMKLSAKSFSYSIILFRVFFSFIRLLLSLLLIFIFIVLLKLCTSVFFLILVCFSWTSFTFYICISVFLYI